MNPSSDDTPDTDLLRQMRAGAADAFQALYRRHQGALYRFALLRCGAGETAADAVQDAYMGLLDGRYRFDPLKGSLRNFLFGVVCKLMLKHDHAQRRTSALPEADDDDDAWEVPDPGALPEARLLQQELAEQVRLALAELAPHYRDVVILYEIQELSYLEIAAICQIDLGTVRSRLARGRAALAKRLARRGHAPAN